MADEIDKYDNKDVSVHFLLYAETDEEEDRGKTGGRGRGVPAGTIRIVKDSLKVSLE
jgi:hypothetical protein